MLFEVFLDYRLSTFFTLKNMRRWQFEELECTIMLISGFFLLDHIISGSLNSTLELAFLRVPPGLHLFFVFQ